MGDGWAGGRDELHAVSAAVLAVTAQRSVHEVLQTIVTSARQLLGARYAALGVPDAVGSFAEFVTDGVDDGQWQAIGPAPRQHGLLGVMLRDPSHLRLADIRRHPRFEGWPAAHPELGSFLGVPITGEGRILGALFLANKPGGFTADDEDLIALLAGHAAIALVNARLHERVRELSVLQERHRIARELHDAVTQKLFSLRLTVEAAATLVDRDPARVADQLGSARRLTAEAVDELRAVVVGLQPPDLAADGLNVALRKHAELLDRSHEPRVRYAGAPVPRLAPDAERAVYRVAQEALHNALRHAAPSTVEVRLERRDPLLVLEVRDDGQGFDTDAPDSGPGTARRLGLASMRDRARVAGGRLTVRSSHGGGTTVRLEVPADA